MNASVMKIILAVLISSLYYVDGCGTANVECLSQTTYQFCFTVGTQVVVVDGVQTCPSGTVCNENGSVVCETGTTTDSTTTESTTTGLTTAATGAPDNCTTAGKYPADTCDQYWECLLVMWWYELVLQTCGTDLSYDSTSQTCVADGDCASSSTTTEITTTTAATTTTTATTTTAATTTTTTATTTSTTTTTAATTTATSVTAPETCTEAGKYPAEACNQYWECVFVMWWYELVLQTCGANQQYDSTSQACVANSTCTL